MVAVALIQGVAGEIQLLRRQAKRPRDQATWFYWFYWFPVPPEELWRIPLLHELLGVRNGSLEVPGVYHEDIKNIIDEICKH